MKKLNLLLTILFLLSLTTLAQAQKTYWMMTEDGKKVQVPADVATVIMNKTKAPDGGAGSVPKYRTFTKDGVVFHENEISWENEKLAEGALTWVTDEGAGVEWKECDTQNPLWNSFAEVLTNVAKPYGDTGKWSQANITIFEGSGGNTLNIAAPKPNSQPVAQKPAQTPPVAQGGGGGTNCSNFISLLTNAEIADILRIHNEIRAAVGTPPLKWNCALAGFGQNWANKDVWGHSKGEDREKIIPGIYAGENISADANSTTTAAQMLQGWIDEKKDFDGGSKTCTPGKVCGHYTQMVWKTTTEIGCGINRKSSTMGDEWKGQATYLVCNYSPGGNNGEEPY